MIALIAEKPSVAKDIARIIGATGRNDGYPSGNGYMVTWAFGHLIQLAMPEAYGVANFRRESLPILPPDFQLIPRQVKAEKGYKSDPGVLKQLKVIKEVFDQCDRIIVATDAGREGELIFRYIFHYLNCRKPFVRLWISSLTDKAIREGLDNLQPGERYDNLYLSAKSRSESDWLVGINATQALSIAAGQGVFSLGRVQTPTLVMICSRYLENKNFVPAKFWQLKVATASGGIVFTVQSTAKWEQQPEAIAALQRVKDAGRLSVKSVERKEASQEPPLLYDLTTLQKEANTKLNFSADKTLSIAQSLYEKKVMSYPRTGSRYISEDVFDEMPERIALLGQYPPLCRVCRRAGRCNTEPPQRKRQQSDRPPCLNHYREPARRTNQRRAGGLRASSRAYAGSLFGQVRERRYHRHIVGWRYRLHGKRVCDESSRLACRVRRTGNGRG